MLENESVNQVPHTFSAPPIISLQVTSLMRTRSPGTFMRISIFVVFLHVRASMRM